MHMVVIIAFAVVLAVPSAVDPVPTTWLLAALGAYWALVGALAALMVHRAVSSLPADASVPPRVLKRGRLALLGGQFWLLVGLVGLVSLGLREAIAAIPLGARLRMEDLPALPELLAAAPFFVGLAVLWRVYYPFHRACRQRLSLSVQATGRRALPVWTAWQYLEFQFRHNVLFIAVPVSLILIATAALDMYVWRSLPDGAAWTVLMMVGSLAVPLGVFLVAPVLIVRIWRTRSLPPGPLRDDLEQMCQRMGVGCRDLRVWVSGGVVANAGAMGLIGPLRYILLSDAVLEDMPEPQIRAIFAHELGHVAERHLYYLALFAIAAMLTAMAAGMAVHLAVGTMAPGLDKDVVGGIELVVTVLCMVVAWGLGFGAISRRFERQSDVVGAWASGPGGPPADRRDPCVDVAGAMTFADSLRMVAELNGIDPHQRNWRHGPIAWRVDYIRQLGLSGGTRAGIDRVVRWIKIGLIVVAAGALAAVIVLSQWTPVQ